MLLPQAAAEAPHALLRREVGSGKEVGRVGGAGGRVRVHGDGTDLSRKKASLYVVSSAFEEDLMTASEIENCCGKNCLAIKDLALVYGIL